MIASEVVVFSLNNVTEEDLFGSALMATPNRTFLVLTEPVGDVIKVTTVAAYLAPEVHTLDR